MPSEKDPSAFVDRGIMEKPMSERQALHTNENANEHKVLADVGTQSSSSAPKEEIAIQSIGFRGAAAYLNTEVRTDGPNTSKMSQSQVSDGGSCGSTQHFKYEGNNEKHSNAGKVPCDINRSSDRASNSNEEVRFSVDGSMVYPRRRSVKRMRQLSRDPRARVRNSIFGVLNFRSWAIVAFIILFICHAWLWYCAIEVARNELFGKMWWRPVVL